MLNIEDIVPNGDDWIIKNNRLLFKRCGINIPVCIIEDDIIYIFLDNNAMHSIILKLVKKLISLDIEFYFYPPSYSNPATLIDNNTVIYHYLLSYSNEKYFSRFAKIDFSLMDNMIKWCLRENCVYLIKENYQKIYKTVNSYWYDGYRNVKNYKYSNEIRDEFNGLYREIMLIHILK